MRQKLITLCPTTWELAQKKPNFSEWIRNQLRSERNKSENEDSILANNSRKIEELTKLSSRELLWQLEQRTDAEIDALVSLLQQ
jgi:hypothetical protein|tara:strand:+ start:383 stop:634 length:252 start_codon:yes stop_codon:yes gene_type:complete